MVYLQGKKRFIEVKKSGMIMGWKKRGDYWMNIGSPDFVQEPEFKGCLEIRRRESSGLRGLKKNGLRMLRDSTSKLLRQEDTKDTGFIMRGCTDLSGSGGSAVVLPEVWEGEAGGDRLAGQQPFLHKAVCLLRGTEMPWDDRPGCGQRVEAGLAYSKGIGQGVHAGTTPTQPCSSAAGDWDRRNIVKEGTYVPDRGQ